MIYFPPYSDRQTVDVTIRDDQGLPRVEGREEFELVLRTPINSGVGEPSKAVITIDDSASDCKFCHTNLFSLQVFLFYPHLPLKINRISLREHASAEHYQFQINQRP